ncbi:MAG: hypothetical protein QNL04_11690, partial [SAR324 cluster bacterium]|nr:hypothetical protein [SAR324 cluster bacterium]
WGDGEMGRWGDGEMGRWGDGEMGRWGDGEMGRWEERKKQGKKNPLKAGFKLNTGVISHW